MPRATYPEDPESWSESLTPAEGVWWSGTGCGTVYLDRVFKASGDASIRHSTDKCPDYYGSIVFELKDGKEANCELLDKIHFLHAIEPDRNFSGYCSIALWDKHWGDPDACEVSKDFGTVPDGSWQPKEWPVGPEAPDWTESPFNPRPFDWSHVKYIIIYCHFEGVGTGSFWIDRIYFSRPKPKLTIDSSPTGKTFSIDGVPGITPATYEVTPDATYTVSMDPTDFIQWEDGSTNPVRKIAILVDTTITAYYVGGEPPPVPPKPVIPWFWLLPYFYGLVTVIYTTRPK